MKITDPDENVYEMVKLGDLEKGDKFYMADDIEAGWKDRGFYEVLEKKDMTSICLTPRNYRQHYNNRHNVCKI